MGQTLENGVYLPSEGERNCYAGLKTNWEILDQKVADVTALQQAVAGALHREIVESLPTTDIDPNTIYMVLSGTSATENVYNEFMYVNNAWELIGTSATDLTNYYTKSEVDGKLLLKASASDLTSHTGDTTIHVTASDKNKWNNNTYVFRYSSTAVVASSTNSNTLLDNTDNLKVGDKVIDSSGVLFSITAIDTANSTFTIGSALIDLAKDSDVVHTSGNESISGEKRFINDIVSGTVSTNTTLQSRNIIGITTASTTGSDSKSYQQITATLNYSDSSPSKTASVSLYVNENAYTDGKYGAFYPNSNNTTNLGLGEKRWANVYATNYYYGSNKVEFSTKFVTSDTAQTITERKTFTKNVTIKNEDVTIGSTSGAGSKDLTFTDSADNALAKITANKVSNGSSSIAFRVDTTDSNDENINTQFQFFIAKSGVKVINPTPDNDISLGRTSNRWKDTCTCLINGLEPSALSLPSGNASNFIDISSYFSNTGSGDTNSYTASANGWVYLYVTACRTLTAYIQNGTDTIYSDYRERSSDGQIRIMLPIQKNNKFTALWTTSTTVSITKAVFIPCQGNV